MQIGASPGKGLEHIPVAAGISTAGTLGKGYMNSASLGSVVRFVLQVIALTTFIMATYGFGRNIFPIVIPAMSSELDISYMMVGIVTALHQVGYLIFSLLAGRMSQKRPPLTIVVGSVLMCGVCLLVLGVAHQIWIIAVCMTLLGICAATSWVPMVSLIASRVAYQHRAKVLGIVACGTAYGVFINGLAIPPLANSNMGWPAVWLAFGGATLLVGIGGWLVLRQAKPEGARANAQLRKGRGSMEMRPGQLFVLCSIMLLSGLSLIPYQTYLVPYLYDDLHFPLEVGGQAWSAMGLFGMGSGFFLGIIADRATVRRTLIGGYLLLAVGCALLICVPTYAAILTASAIFGLVYFGLFGLHPAYISKMVPADQSALVFGVANLTLGLGSTAGNYLGGLSKDLLRDFETLYLSVAALMILIAGLCLLLRPDQAKQVPLQVPTADAPR